VANTRGRYCSAMRFASAADGNRSKRENVIRR
jgi:hypothetical protein